MEGIKGTVIVSNKNKGLLTVLVQLLQKFFSRVITEHEPEKILELTASGDIDIVILDTGQNCSSEQLEHTSLVRDIIALEQNVQIVVLTNFGQNQFALELADTGAFDFINKPWNNDKLLVTLRNAYRMRVLANELKYARNVAPCQKQCNAGNAATDLTREYKGYQETDNINSEEIKGESSGREKGTERILTLEQMEKKMMKAAIKRNRGNISLAAEQLGITRQTLYNKGKKYKLFE